METWTFRESPSVMLAKPEDTARKLHLYSTQSCVWNIPEGYLGLQKTGENPRILGFIIIFPSFSSFFGHGRHGFWRLRHKAFRHQVWLSESDLGLVMRFVNRPEAAVSSDVGMWYDLILVVTPKKMLKSRNPTRKVMLKTLLSLWGFFSWSIQQGWYSQWNQRVMGDISHNWRWNKEPETTPTFRAWSQNAFNLKQEPQDCSSGFLIGIGFMFDVFF